MTSQEIPGTGRFFLNISITIDIFFIFFYDSLFFKLTVFHSVSKNFNCGCCTKCLGFESRVKHVCQTVCVCPTNDRAVMGSKTGRREVPGSIPGSACRPTRSEIFVVFSEKREKMSQDPLERPPKECTLIHKLRSVVRQSAIESTTNQRTKKRSQL